MDEDSEAFKAMMPGLMKKCFETCADLAEEMADTMVGNRGITGEAALRAFALAISLTNVHVFPCNDNDSKVIH
jgi:hypothetical protein